MLIETGALDLNQKNYQLLSGKVSGLLTLTNKYCNYCWPGPKQQRDLLQVAALQHGLCVKDILPHELKLLKPANIIEANYQASFCLIKSRLALKRLPKGVFREVILYALIKLF